MFSTLPKTNFNFSAKFNLLSANAFHLDQAKNLSFGKELKGYKVFDRVLETEINTFHSCEEYRARSDCMYVQADLALHSKINTW